VTKKKVLIVHNKYRNLGGEDLAVDNEIEFLQEHFNVEVLYFTNKVLIVKQILTFISNKNFFAERKILKKVHDFKPEIVYFHNTWFNIWNNIFIRLGKKTNIQIFLKLHNYRFDCTKTYSAKSHFHNSKVCMGCGGESKSKQYFNKYFDNSYIKSFLVNYYGKRYYNILKNENIKILNLTNFQREFMINQGFNKQRLFVFPNLIKLENFQEIKCSDYVLYAGRISNEKGVSELIDIFSSVKTNYKLLIIGDGPEANNLKIQKNKNIKFLGELNHHKTLSYINSAKAVITNTKLYEGQPTLLCEASLLSVPSIFPDNGGIKEFFPKDYQLKFNHNNTNSLRNILKNLDSFDLIALGKQNFTFTKNILNNEKLSKKFMDIYNNG